MKIRASLENRKGLHQVTLTTDGIANSIAISPKSTGFGSSVNGGELLFLALATCYCNDIYREAGKRGIQVESVEVAVEGDFGGEGEPAKNLSYRARVAAQASEEIIRDLMEHTDQLAEIQNTLRTGIPVHLSQLNIVPVL